jgi:hypothetical protein
MAREIGMVLNAQARLHGDPPSTPAANAFESLTENRHSTRLVAAGFALVCTGTARAAPGALSFTFAPLQCTSTSWDEPIRDCGLTTLSGIFNFDDFNGDGHIVLAELLQLSVGDITVPGPGQVGQPGQVFSFDYASLAGLRFSAYDDYRTNVTTGVSYRYDTPNGSQIYAWLPTTTTSISPVPEPVSFWLLLAGSTALLLRQRRQFALQPLRKDTSRRAEPAHA